MTTKKENKQASDKRTLTSMSLSEVIVQCGRLNYPIDKTVSILHAKDQTINTHQIRQQLTTQGTSEYQAYQSGIDAAQFEADTALLDAAISGDADAQELLRKVQKEKIITDSVQENFFPDNDA